MKSLKKAKRRLWEYSEACLWSFEGEWKRRGTLLPCLEMLICFYWLLSQLKGAPKWQKQKQLPSPQKQAIREQALWKTERKTLLGIAGWTVHQSFSGCCYIQFIIPTGVEFGPQGGAKNQKTGAIFPFPNKTIWSVEWEKSGQDSHGDFQWEHLSKT